MLIYRQNKTQLGLPSGSNTRIPETIRLNARCGDKWVVADKCLLASTTAASALPVERTDLYLQSETHRPIIANRIKIITVREIKSPSPQYR